jgi:prophage regulatory protein
MRRILREREVAELTHRSRVSRWRDERAGRFPLRVRIGPNAVGWFADDIQVWLEARPRGIRTSDRAA